MTNVSIAINMFAGVKTERMVWLPTITLGYIYTLSGSLSDFALGVTAIGGARFCLALIQSEEFDNKNAVRDMQVLVSDLSTLTLLLYASLMALYALATVRGIYQLYIYFTHTDLILVGFAGVYWGALILVVIDFVRSIGATVGEDKSDTDVNPVEDDYLT